MNLSATIATAPDIRARRGALQQLRGRLGVQEVREPDAVDLLKQAMAANQGYEAEISCLVQALLHYAEASEGSYEHCMKSYVSGQPCEISSGCFDGDVPDRWITGLEELIPWMVADIVIWAKKSPVLDRRGTIGRLIGASHQGGDYSVDCYSDFEHGWGLAIIDAPPNWDGFIRIRDWLRGTGTDYRQILNDDISLDAVADMANDWHDERFVVLAEDEITYLEWDGPRLLEWEDGWHVVQLSTPEDLKQESDSLGHCVEGYTRELASDQDRILSLRRPDSKPVMTVHQQLQNFMFTPESGLVGSPGAGSFFSDDRLRSPTRSDGIWFAKLWVDQQALGLRNMRLLGRYQDKALRMLRDPRLDEALDQDAPRPYVMMNIDGLVLLSPEDILPYALDYERGTLERLPISPWLLMEIKTDHHLQMSEPWHDFRLDNNTSEKIGIKISPINSGGFASIPHHCYPEELAKIENVAGQLLDDSYTKEPTSWFEWVVVFGYDLKATPEGWKIAMRASWGPHYVFNGWFETLPGEDPERTSERAYRMIGIAIGSDTGNTYAPGGTATVKLEGWTIRDTQKVYVSTNRYIKRASIGDNPTLVPFGEEHDALYAPWNETTVRESVAGAMQIARDELDRDHIQHGRTVTMHVPGIGPEETCVLPQVAQRIYQQLEQGITAAHLHTDPEEPTG